MDEISSFWSQAFSTSKSQPVIVAEFPLLKILYIYRLQFSDSYLSPESLSHLSTSSLVHLFWSIQFRVLWLYRAPFTPFHPHVPAISICVLAESPLFSPPPSFQNLQIFLLLIHPSGFCHMSYMQNFYYFFQS